jgi:hypothetical protein
VRTRVLPTTSANVAIDPPHDRHFDARVVELVFEFVRRIERIHVDLDRADPRERDEHHRKRQHVGQHHGHAVALAHLRDLLQVRGERGRQAVDVRIGQRAVGRAERRMAGEAASRRPAARLRMESDRDRSRRGSSHTTRSSVSSSCPAPRGRRHAAPFARRPAHRMRAGRRLTDEYRARGPL